MTREAFDRMIPMAERWTTGVQKAIAEFDVPWNDLDNTRTKLYPVDKPRKFKVDLYFRSGLRLIVTDVPPHSWASEFRDDLKLSAEQTTLLFGDKVLKSDYGFVETLYEFTPEKMNRWTFIQGNREGTLLLVKSLVLPKWAETGIFRLRSDNYRGFQLGDPNIPQKELLVDLYSNEGSVEFSFRSQTGQKSSLVSQPEINRIIQTLRRSTPAAPKT